MIRTAKVIFCDNEHGMGEITYPDLSENAEALLQHFINSPTFAQLRKDAKKGDHRIYDGRGQWLNRAIHSSCRS